MRIVSKQRGIRQMFLVAALGAAQLISLGALGQSVGLRQVQINSRWGGLGKPAASELTIVKQGSKFRLGQQSIDPALLDRLIDALREPDISQIDLANLGITKAWLASNHRGPNSHYLGGPEVQAENQQALYEKRFEDLSFIYPLLSRTYQVTGSQCGMGLHRHNGEVDDCSPV